MRKYLVFAIGIALLFGISCSPGDQGTGDAEKTAVKAEVKTEVKAEVKEPIKIGAILAITGNASWLGEPERNTILMIAEKVNAAGGINGRKIELVIEDCEGIPANAVTSINKLIKQDKVCAIVGPSRSGVAMALKPIAEANEVPLIACAAAEAIVNPISKWVFKTPQNDSDCVIRIFEHMKTVNISKIAIITGTTGFGNAGRKQLVSIAAKMGITIVADETYNPPDTDMTAQLTKIRGTDAQAIVNWSIVPAQSIVPKNMRQLTMKIPLYQSHGFGNINYVKQAGPAANGIIFPAGALLAFDSLPADHPRKALLAKYAKDYKTKFNATASTFGGHAYDALTLVISALEKTGTDDKAALRDAIESTTNFKGTAGTFNYSATDHCGLEKDAFELITVKDEKFVLYTP